MNQESESASICHSCGTKIPRGENASVKASESDTTLCKPCLVSQRRKVQHAAAVDSLPPKFITPGVVPTVAEQSGKVLLPNADGGTDSVDQRTVHIEHKGELIELKMLTPEQRRRRRIIYNCLAFVIAVGMLWLAYKILTY